MQHNSEAVDTTALAFQMDLLRMNLHLTETEQSPERQTRAHEAALEQMRTLVPRA